jgi:uncharacterized protein (DUF2252 family)
MKGSPTNPGEPATPGNARLSEAFARPLPSIEERFAAGKALRGTVPRTSHGDFTARQADRRVVAVLKAQAASRLAPLVPVRHARMLASPFAFLRGSAAIMAADLARLPCTELAVQACGDMHLANFGLYASAERKLIFGINDFDETQAGPWEWDLKRLVASAVVAGRYIGADRTDQQAAAHRVVTSYRDRLREYAQMPSLDVWYATLEARTLLELAPPEVRARALEIVEKARARGHTQVLNKMTEIVGDRQRIIEQRPLIVRSETLESGKSIAEGIGLFLDAYLASLAPERRLLLGRYRIVDVARKVVGVGSVGTRCWMIYMQGATKDDPLFLQIKEAQESVLAPHWKTTTPPNHGLRVVIGQRLLQGSPDIFLGWGIAEGRHFYVRQLRDMKGGPAIEPGVTKPSYLSAHCAACGWALALAHAKSGDPAAMAGYIGKSDALADALVRFGEAYADQTEIDHAIMAQAAERGEIPVAR